MATRTLTDADIEPTLETTWLAQWPTLERDHEPTPLVTNDRTETDQTTLAEHGLALPDAAPERPTVPVDDRDRTEQTRVFDFPKPWTDDADRLEALFADRSLSELVDLFDGYRCFETVRSRLKKYGIRDPSEPKSLADRLAAADPGDVGDPLPAGFNRGEKA
ncbi:hypothetical protein [Natronorubrum texcoconense]|nr:hypothetical protein [Natronorubrum texcoconense]